MLALLSGLNNMFCEDRPRDFSRSIRIEDRSARLNGLPCSVERSDKSANLIWVKCPWVFLEKPAHFTARVPSGESATGLSATDAWRRAAVGDAM
jgi:hypothetical protein